MAIQLLIHLAVGLASGYLLELVYRSSEAGRIKKPLFINAQMYGLSAAFIYLASTLAIPTLFRFALIMTGITLIEFLTGYGYLKIKGIRLWDYSEYSLNYRGFVCLRFSLYWTALALPYYYFVVPFLADII